MNRLAFVSRLGALSALPIIGPIARRLAPASAQTETLRRFWPIGTCAVSPGTRYTYSVGFFSIWRADGGAAAGRPVISYRDAIGNEIERADIGGSVAPPGAACAQVGIETDADDWRGTFGTPCLVIGPRHAPAPSEVLA
ncbi:MAG: hypothetical protein ABSD03_09360 [Vulcanimicrobiaceae bacterium]